MLDHGTSLLVLRRVSSYDPELLIGQRHFSRSADKDFAVWQVFWRVQVRDGMWGLRPKPMLHRQPGGEIERTYHRNPFFALRTRGRSSYKALLPRNDRLASSLRLYVPP